MNASERIDQLIVKLTDWRGKTLAGIRKTLPDYSVEDFLTAMQLSPDAAALFREAARRILDA